VKAGARNGVGAVAGLAAVPALGILRVQALIVAGLLVTVLVGALCWVVSDGGRAERLALIIRVWHGGRRRS
jgi:hypothetical protein